MKLPFRYQFIIAPTVIVILLAGLIAYTLFELSKIYNENDVTKNWEILTDRIQSAIASINRLDSAISELSPKINIQENDQFFSYLEQTSIVSDTLFDPTLFPQLPIALRQQIENREQLLRSPEEVNPTTLILSLNVLLPDLEHQYKLFVAQRRTSFIKNHRQVVAISTRMTIVLLTGLILCIALATGLALWGLGVTRKRLNHLTQQAHQVCMADNASLTPPACTHDELDDLESCLTNMTQRLLTVVSMKNVLQGAECERRRIAMDMHDGVLADLTAVNRRLDGLDAATYNLHSIKQLRNDVDTVINHLRCTIDDLHPQVLETLGLESALQSFLKRHSAIAGYPDYYFEYVEEIEKTLSSDAKLSLFRIITEAINNVIKHARCDRFEISFRLVSQQLVASVEDNGVGIPNDGNNTGHGCANITERAKLMGATVQWRRSRFASGTCFEIKMRLS